MFSVTVLTFSKNINQHQCCQKGENDKLASHVDILKILFLNLKKKQFVQKKNRPVEKRFTQWIFLLIGLAANSSVYVYILYLHSVILPVQQQCG